MDAQAASDILYAHWMDGTRIDALPDTVRPQTRAEGYAVQALLEPRSPAPLFGWKIAATSAAGQAHINVDGPLAGRILQERLIEPGAECPFGTNHMKVAELEFAFRMGRTLEPGRIREVDEVLAAVASLHLAIEIPDSRYNVFEAVGAPQLIADNACANYFIVGPETPDLWRALNLAVHEVTGSIGQGQPQRGIGSNVLGDPRVALAWLANELSRHGIVLREGQTVSTGTCVKPMAIGPGDSVRGDFGVLGTIDVRMGDWPRG
jgi:2-keto-4-pentenoate hydratase